MRSMHKDCSVYETHLNLFCFAYVCTSAKVLLQGNTDLQFNAEAYFPLLPVSKLLAVTERMWIIQVEFTTAKYVSDPFTVKLKLLKRYYMLFEIYRYGRSCRL